MTELKKTIQDSVSEMIDGSSVLIRLTYFLIKHSDESSKRFADLLNDGKLYAWMTSFQSLSTKIKSHFIQLRSVLLNFMNIESNTDYENELEKYNQNFEDAIDSVCPVKGGGDDKRQFFIEGICGCSGIGFNVDKFHTKGEKADFENLDHSFDSQIPKIPSSYADDDFSKAFDGTKKGLLMQTQREDGKGSHFVSKSIADMINNPLYADYDPNKEYGTEDNENVELFNVESYEINIGDSKN